MVILGRIGLLALALVDLWLELELLQVVMADFFLVEMKRIPITSLVTITCIYINSLIKTE